jgi:hypothetical protein
MLHRTRAGEVTWQFGRQRSPVSVSLAVMRLLTIILGLFVGACSGRVLVVDMAGNPIEGAQLTPQTLSMGGAAVSTNHRGEASVPLRIWPQDTRWVNVSKQGFQWQQVKVPAKWPLKVILKQAKKP